MDIKEIDLSRYRKTGEGANGESFDSLDDPSVMVKLYNAFYPVQPIFDEQEVAAKVYCLGIPSPEPGEVVSAEGRYGIRFRRVEGKRSFSRMFADEPERTEEFARELARLCKVIHRTECPEGLFPDAKGQFLAMLDAVRDVYTPEEYDWLRGFIATIPDCGTALHGDMHFGNVITTLPLGAPLTCEHESYFIDLGYFASGCPLIDLGMMLNICFFSTDEFVRHDMHISKAQAGQVLRHFLDEYFYHDDCPAARWLPGVGSVDEIIEALRPYYCVKSILITYNLRRVLPEIREELRYQMGIAGAVDKGAAGYFPARRY